MPVLVFIMHDQRQIYLMEVLTSITAIFLEDGTIRDQDEKKRTRQCNKTRW